MGRCFIFTRLLGGYQFAWRFSCIWVDTLVFTSFCLEALLDPDGCSSFYQFASSQLYLGRCSSFEQFAGMARLIRVDAPVLPVCLDAQLDLGRWSSFK